MNRIEAMGCISLMGLLWTSYKPPKEEKELEALVNTWLAFFKGVDVSEVTHAIHATAAEGGEFAPQIGQIYNTVKGKRKELTAQKYGDTPSYKAAFKICCYWAELYDKASPQYGDDLGEWYGTVQKNYYYPTRRPFKV